MTNTEALQARWQSVMMNNYGTPAMALAGGDGAIVTDPDGKTYLDLLGGIAVNLLGHRHPAIIDAVTTQLNTLGHVSNFYATEPGIALAEGLVGHLGSPAKVFFCNSGTEANEVAFKITRLTGRTKVVAAEGGFHGRTMGSLALTGQPSKREPFEPLPAGVTHVPYGDVEALTVAVGDETAAVFLEPIMGRAASLSRRPDTLRQRGRSPAGTARCWCSTRCRPAWDAPEPSTHLHDGITPDVVTLAKGLGGGLPIGACLAVGATADLLTPACTAAPSAVTRCAPRRHWPCCAPWPPRTWWRVPRWRASTSAPVSKH